LNELNKGVNLVKVRIDKKHFKGTKSIQKERKPLEESRGSRQGGAAREACRIQGAVLSGTPWAHEQTMLFKGRNVGYKVIEFRDKTLRQGLNVQNPSFSGRQVRRGYDLFHGNQPGQNRTAHRGGGDPTVFEKHSKAL
jgi:hypothetical protein